MVFGYHKGASLIRQLNISLFSDETTALIGPNGAGKTTLGKLLTGILKPSAGQLFIFGDDVKSLPLYHIGQRLGYCFQNPHQQLLTASVEEEIAFGLKYRGASREYIDHTVNSLLDLFEIEHLRRSFPFNISWGEKRRVVLAACLALNPQYLVMDEPTVGLDEERIRTFNQVLAKLRENGIGMLLISHDRDFVRENAGRILQIEGGAIINDCRV